MYRLMCACTPCMYAHVYVGRVWVTGREKEEWEGESRLPEGDRSADILGAGGEGGGRPAGQWQQVSTTPGAAMCPIHPLLRPHPPC